MLLKADADARPHLEVKVFGYPLLGLLDSGSSRTIVGAQGWKILQELGLDILRRERQVLAVADGNTCKIEGVIDTPIELYGRVCTIPILVVPKVKALLVLGTDFWKAMHLTADLSAGTWTFATPPEICNAIELTPIIQDQDHLTADQQRRLKDLTSRHLRRMGTKLGVTTMVEHRIDTGQAVPVKQRYYRVSPIIQEVINKELEKMLADGVVEPSTSSWSSPLRLVQKPQGGYRVCVDFRQVNALSKKDAYPLPYVSQILDQLRNARFLSSLDIKSAFWQIPLEEGSREKTAFTVPGRGLFQFKKMPFGLHNSPATWQRLIDKVLGHDLEPFLFVYLDDIVVVTQTFEQHYHVLDQVFERLQTAGLTLNVEKCEFCRPSLRYLGYVIDARGLRVDPDKVTAILNVPRPANVREVRKFVGVASWYRRFIPDFATRLEPLTSMQRKNQKFLWTEAAENAFTDIKNLLIQAPILSCPDFTLPFQVQTDASGVGLGAVLYQDFPEGERVIAYASRTLTQAEKKFSATELECLAVLWTVEKWRPYLEGYTFTVHTDHASLLWLHNLKDPQGRLARWALRLQQFDFSIVHRKGKDNVVADFLSRAPLESLALVNFPNPVRDPWYLKMLDLVTTYPERYPAWRVDDNVLYKYVKADRKLLDPAAEWKIVVPKEARETVFAECHDSPTSGHLGIYKTCRRIIDKYYWPQLRMDTTRYIRRCPTCQRVKVEQKLPAGQMGQERNVDGPWRRISADLMGPMPRSTAGNKYLLVVTDTFSKYSLLFPLRSATSKLVAQKIEDEVFLVYGAAEILVCDNGPEFVGAPFKKMAQEYHCTLHYNAKRHPQANPTERTNRTVLGMLRSYITDNHKLWDKHVPKIGCALRTAVSEVTGYTPVYLNFGRELILCGVDHRRTDLTGIVADHVDKMQGLKAIFTDIRARLRRAHQQNAARYNLRRRPLEFQVGDRVLKRDFHLSNAADNYAAKLAPRYEGPFEISKKTSPLIYRLQDVDGRDLGTWHIKDLRSYNVV